MRGKSRAAIASIGLAGILAIALVGMVTKSEAGQAPSQSPTNSTKTAEQVYKNIQVLKGVPADRLIPAMQFITASLGVGCDFCHVEGSFDKDDKKPKQVARKMMTMMFAINKDNFEDHREVTCNSCHRGTVRPVAIPAVSDEPPKPMQMAMGGGSEAPKPDLSKLPSAADVIDKYVQASGGASAIEKISSRTESGSITAFAGRQLPMEMFYAVPDKGATLLHFPNGDSITIFKGQEGWTAFPGRPLRPLEGADLDAFKMDADVHFPIDLNKMFGEFKVAQPEKIGGQDAYQILGLRPGMPPVEMYFDEQSGLLVRLVRYSESPLGLNPTRIDYADYRDAGGVKIPFRLTTARPGGNSTLQLDQVKQNVAIDEAKFAKPPAPPMPEKK